HGKCLTCGHCVPESVLLAQNAAEMHGVARTVDGPVGINQACEVTLALAEIPFTEIAERDIGAVLRHDAQIARRAHVFIERLDGDPVCVSFNGGWVLIARHGTDPGPGHRLARLAV